MNTVFKLYYHAWSLLAIPVAIMGMWLLFQARNQIKGIPRSAGGADSMIRLGALLGIVLVPVLQIAQLAYPLRATPNRIEADMTSSPAGLTLAGYEWMDGGSIRNDAGDVISFTGDKRPIEWLRASVDTNAVILEAALGPYVVGGSRISSATGLPTALGWNSHQSQQRGGDAVHQRSRDVRKTYSTDDIARKRYLLRQYSVDNVILDDVERHILMAEFPGDSGRAFYASASGLEAYDRIVDKSLETVFEAEGTRIYRVNDFVDAGQGT